MPDQTRPSTVEAPTRVRTLMLDYVEKVAEHFGFVRVEPRPEHQRLRALLGSSDREAVLHELQLAIARRPERLGSARNHAELLRRIDELLTAALAKVERDRADAKLYAEAPAEELDPDPSFRHAANRSAARDWPT